MSPVYRVSLETVSCASFSSSIILLRCGCMNWSDCVLGRRNWFYNIRSWLGGFCVEIFYDELLTLKRSLLPQSVAWLLLGFGGNLKLIVLCQYSLHHIETRQIQYLKHKIPLQWLAESLCSFILKCREIFLKFTYMGLRQQMLFSGHQDALKVIRAEITERDHDNWWCIVPE